MLLTSDGKVPVRWWTVKTNFGDLLAPWLARKMTGRDVAFVEPAEPHYLLVGSILSMTRPSSIVWGIGAFGVEPQGQICAEATYHAVRGPLTRNKIVTNNIDCPRVYGDPALLVPRYYTPAVPVTHEVGLVLRWSERKWQKNCDIPGVKKIYLKSDDIEGTIDAICSCKRILSSSLHGLIIADAYGIPNAWLASESPYGREFKFWDYFASVDKLRRPVKYDLLAPGLTWQRVCHDVRFNEQPIDIDLDMLMQSCPLCDHVERDGPMAQPFHDPLLAE